jgi:hypothetical protein
VRGAVLGLLIATSTAASTLSVAAPGKAHPPAATASKLAGGKLHATIPAGPPPAILSLSEVRPGMVGHALTVFQGTKPEPFKIRVVSVLRNFLPK